MQRPEDLSMYKEVKEATASLNRKRITGKNSKSYGSHGRRKKETGLRRALSAMSRTVD